MAAVGQELDYYLTTRFRLDDGICNGYFVLAALLSRCGHYIFILWFLLLSIFYHFFLRLFSVVTDWMSTILPHVV